MRRHHSTVSALLETPYLDVPRGDLGTLPFSRAWTPEQRLMGAVLDDAIRSWRRLATMPGRRATRLRDELRDWFVSDTDSPFSFANACAHLGLSPGVIRAHLDWTRVADQAA